MLEWFHFVLGLLGVVILVVTLVEIGFWSDDENYYKCLTPIHLHYYTEMNWFGCYATWLLLGIVSPLVFIVKLGWFIFHIGKFEDIL